jgi:hypothetical protein
MIQFRLANETDPPYVILRVAKDQFNSVQCTVCSLGGVVFSVFTIN